MHGCMQCNAIQCNAIQYNTIHPYIYIYIYPFFGAYLIFRQTNFPGCVPPISFEVSWYFAVWNGVCAGFGASKPRVTPKFRQQTETPFLPFPATQGIRTRPVWVESTGLRRIQNAATYPGSKAWTRVRPQCVDGQSQNKLPQFLMFNTLFSH